MDSFIADFIFGVPILILLIFLILLSLKFEEIFWIIMSIAILILASASFGATTRAILQEISK